MSNQRSFYNARPEPIPGCANGCYANAAAHSLMSLKCSIDLVRELANSGTIVGKAFAQLFYTADTGAAMKRICDTFADVTRSSRGSQADCHELIANILGGAETAASAYFRITYRVTKTCSNCGAVNSDIIDRNTIHEWPVAERTLSESQFLNTIMYTIAPVNGYKCKHCSSDSQQVATKMVRGSNVLMILKDPLPSTGGLENYELHWPHNLEIPRNTPPPVVYELRAIVYNYSRVIGNTTAGHYTCAVKRGTDWYRIDGGSISPIAPPSPSANDHILFYELAGTKY